MKSVYTALSEHQTTQTWEKQALFRELHRWAGIFDAEFKLKIPQVAICVDQLHRRRHGHFRAGPNGFGLSAEIGINQRNLTGRPFWQVLGTLLHEQLHAWQQAHGKPGQNNYHNKELRAKAECLGLIIDTRGVTEYRRPSLFTQLLERHGIVVPKLATPDVRRPHGTSKLKKWSCRCTNVRVAVADFRARCLKCDFEFRKVNS